jgi:hypothetical protein
LSNRAGSSQDKCRIAFKTDVSRCADNSCGGGAVRAVAIDHHRNFERIEHGIDSVPEDLFSMYHIGTTDENGSVFEILWTAGIHGPMHKIPNLLGFNVGILKQPFSPGVYRNHGIEDASLRIGIELD